jgi:hypothetical protein
VSGSLRDAEQAAMVEATRAREEDFERYQRRADVVTCCLCDKQWPEDDDGVWWRGYDAYCTDYDACTTRQIEQEAASDGVQ